jgi:hypothetical protein
MVISILLVGANANLTTGRKILFSVTAPASRYDAKCSSTASLWDWGLVTCNPEVVVCFRDSYRETPQDLKSLSTVCK